MQRVPVWHLRYLVRRHIRRTHCFSTKVLPDSIRLDDLCYPITTSTKWMPRQNSFRQARRLTSEASPSSPRMTDLSGLGPKRFYENVSTRPHPNKSRTEHAIVLDGKTVKTPRGGVLATPTIPLSTAVAAEWDAQEGRIRPSSMPLTTLVSTARDIVPSTRERVVEALLRYIHTDAVCLRPDTPNELVEAQDRACEPVLSLLRESGIELVVTRGALSATQTDDVVNMVRGCAEELDNYSLAALESACGCAKSVAVGLAMLRGLNITSAIDAARAEERWQTKVWGVVEGGHDLDEADLEVRLRAADMVFRFVEQEPEAFRSVPANEGVEGN